MTQAKLKSFFVRLDKMGDLISTLPSDQFQQTSPQTSPQREVFWLISKGLENVIECADPKRNYKSFVIQSKSWKQTWNNFLTFLNFLKSEKPDEIIFFYSPWWATLAAWLAKVPARGGRLSQWHQFLFLNNGIRQSRSQSDKHEADYNFEIVKKMLQLPEDTPTPLLKLTSKNSQDLFDKLPLKKFDYYVIHPGMAGSALNWPTSFYKELIHLLIQNFKSERDPQNSTMPSKKILISGTALDKKFLDDLRSDFEHHPLVLWGEGRFNIPQMINLLEHSKAVLAPSTGVVHLSACSGAPTVGIYSPIQVQSPLRWAPRGPIVTTITPKNMDSSDIPCPAKHHCVGGSCRFFPCMEKISVNQVYNELKQIEK
jgi:ADP-heptose:LPS heptosyltransferase